MVNNAAKNHRILTCIYEYLVKILNTANQSTSEKLKRTGINSPNITLYIQDISQKKKNGTIRLFIFDIKNSLVNVSVVGSTASVITLEYEPGLVVDLPQILNTIAPVNRVYEHDNTWHDGNGYAHLRAALLGNCVTVPSVDGFLEIGRWQQIVLLDFDNKPRIREIVVTMTY